MIRHRFHIAVYHEFTVSHPKRELRKKALTIIRRRQCRDTDPTQSRNDCHREFPDTNLFVQSQSYSRGFPPNFLLHRFRHHMPNPSSTDIRSRLHISDNWISGKTRSSNCQSQHRDLSLKHWGDSYVVTESSDERESWKFLAQVSKTYERPNKAAAFGLSSCWKWRFSIRGDHWDSLGAQPIG